MSIKIELQKIKGARWAIARKTLTGELVSLIENTPILRESEMRESLRTLGLPFTQEVINRYFPQNKQGQHCPTFELISLWYGLQAGSAFDAKGRV